MPSEQAEAARQPETESGDVVRDAIALTKRIEELQRKLKPLTDQLAALQPKLLEWFERSGDQRRTVDGKTAYLRRELWVYPEKDVDKDVIAEKLKEAKLGDFVKESFNVSSISAYARELEKEADWEDSGALLEDATHPLLVAHPKLEGFLVPSEKFSVRIIQG